MHGKLISSITALAGVAAAAPSTQQHKARATEWQATSVTNLFAGHGIVAGASFDLSASANYILDAPAFDVRCDAYYSYGGVAEGTVCAFKDGSAQPKYSTVRASVDYNTLTVNVNHQWLAGNSYRKVSSAAGTLTAKPNYEVVLGDFPLTVSDDVTQVPGLVGDFGAWTATEADFVRDSEGRDRGMQYKLSAPEGYAVNAPGFEVSCFYDYNPDASVFPECTPIGDAAAGSKVSLWASVLYDITTVHHEWTAADGTKYQLVGTSDPLPQLGAEVAEFTIKPDVLNTL